MRVYRNLGRKWIDFSFATERERQIEADKLCRTRAIKSPDHRNAWVNIDWIDFACLGDAEWELYAIINHSLRHAQAA